MPQGAAWLVDFLARAAPDVRRVIVTSAEAVPSRTGPGVSYLVRPVEPTDLLAAVVGPKDLGPGASRDG